jgi:hypothetical protein
LFPDIDCGLTSFAHHNPGILRHRAPFLFMSAVLENGTAVCSLRPEQVFCDADDVNPYAFTADQLYGDVTYTDLDATPPVIETTSTGAGFNATDFALIISIDDTSLCDMSMGVLACMLTAAHGLTINVVRHWKVDTSFERCSPTLMCCADGITCQRDQYDRPIIGRLNLCASSLVETSDATLLQPQIDMAVHEMAHALGFSRDSWPLFRRRDNARTPLTPRNRTNPSMPTDSFAMEDCSGNTVYIPDTSTTVGYFAERGMAECSTAAQRRDTQNCVHRMITPMTRFAAQWFYGCDTLPGMELENQLLKECDIQGSHWEQRVANGELMASVATGTTFMSPMTLAMFEDSGWYSVNFTAAQAMIPVKHWGFKQGCAFASTSKCLSPTGVSNGIAGQFYGVNTDLSVPVCTYDRTSMAYVNIESYGSIPTQFQYLSSQPRDGGDPFMDYCPAAKPVDMGDCRNIDNLMDVEDNAYGNTYGPTSRCLVSSLIYATDNDPIDPIAGCFTIQCQSPTSYNVLLAPKPETTTRVGVLCTAGGTTKTVRGYSGNIQCVDPAILCGTAGQMFNASVPTPFATPSSTPRASITQSNSPTQSRTRTAFGQCE